MSVQPVTPEQAERERRRQINIGQCLLAMSKGLFKTVPAVRRAPLRGSDRNQPCKCGSKKKAKRCCLKY